MGSIFRTGVGPSGSMCVARSRESKPSPSLCLLAQLAHNSTIPYTMMTDYGSVATVKPARPRQQAAAKRRRVRLVGYDTNGPTASARWPPAAAAAAPALAPARRASWFTSTPTVSTARYVVCGCRGDHRSEWTDRFDRPTSRTVSYLHPKHESTDRLSTGAWASHATCR